MGNGEVLRSAEFQRQRCALDDEIHLLGFGQNDLIAVGEREGYAFIVLYDAFEERVAVFSLIAVRTVLTDRFDRLSVFAFDGFAVDLPIAVLVDGRGFTVLARNRNLVLVIVEQPLVIAAQRPVVDAFELRDADGRRRCAVFAVVQRDGLAVVESDRAAPVRRFGVVGDEFVFVQGVDDRLERIDLFLHRSDLLF